MINFNVSAIIGVIRFNFILRKHRIENKATYRGFSPTCTPHITLFLYRYYCLLVFSSDGHCGGGNPGSLAHMFQDMFVSNTQADAMVQEAKWNLRNSGNKYSWANSFIETERMSKTIGRLNPGTGNSIPGSGNSNPGSGNSNPGSGNSNPGSGISNPGSGNTNPGSGNSNPGGGNTNPGRGNSNPGRGNSNTGGGNSIPGSGSCCET